ncbi:MAG: extracellular solute-binding protein [Lachnospiraceae bacterium]|nr:extracellular solute-binding protein [Lachnospiraceae bacterium]
MKKKLVALLMTFGMTVGLISGCGGNSDTQSKAGEDDVYHMVMQITTYGFDDADLGMVQDAVNEITVPEIGVEVEFMTIPIMEQATKLGLLVSSNTQIDLVCTGLLTTPTNLVAQGLLTDITEYVEASDELMALSEGILDACKVDGKIYAYPGATANGVQVTYFYDADLAEQYNIQLPERITSEDDWNSIFSQVKESGMEQYAISLGDGVAAEYEWNDFDALGDAGYNSYGVIFNEDDKVVNFYGTKEYAKKCETHRKWYQEGYCVPDSSSNGYTTSDSMANGQIFGFVSNGGVGMSSAYWSKITGKNIAGIPMSDITTTADNVINFSWGVSSTCENPQKVVDFLELLYTNVDLMNLMNYGIEGTHYVTNEGSKIISYPDGVDATTVGYGNFVGTYGDSSKIYQREPLTDEFVEHIPDYMYPNAATSKYIGFTFNSEKVSTQVENVLAVIQEYAPALECGIVEPEEQIKAFNEALEAAGMNDIIAECQSQLDAWLAQQ